MCDASRIVATITSEVVANGVGCTVAGNFEIGWIGISSRDFGDGEPRETSDQTGAMTRWMNEDMRRTRNKKDNFEREG